MNISDRYKYPLAVILKEAKLGEANLRGEKQCFTYTIGLLQISYALLFTTKFRGDDD